LISSFNNFFEKTKSETRDHENDLNYLCAIRWKIILDISEQQIDSKININISKIEDKEKKRFENLMNYKTICGFIEDQQTREDFIFGVGSSANKVQKDDYLKKLWFYKYCDKHFGYNTEKNLPSETKISKDFVEFIEDAQHWDIEERERLWIFQIFSIEEFIESFQQHNLGLIKITNYLKQVWCGKTKDPLWTLFLHGKDKFFENYSLKEIIDCGTTFSQVKFNYSLDENVENSISFQLVSLLIKEGLDINTKYKDGKTLLHFAVQQNIKHLVKSLLEINCNISNDNNLMSPVDVAMRIKDDELVSLVSKTGFDNL